MTALFFIVLFFVALGLVLHVKTYPQFAFLLDATVTTALAAYLAKLVVSGLRRSLKTRVSTQNKAVFVTGCDTGFGHEAAKYLDSVGFHVFAGCLKPEEEGALELKSSCSSKLHIVPLDVTSDESVSEALQYIKKHLGDKVFWAVVNNAGVIHFGELEWATIELYKSVFDVNTWGVVRVTEAFLPLLRRSKGRVVTVTSFITTVFLPGLGVYTMSKMATQAFSEVLRMEMKKWGVKASTIEPFAYRTALTSNRRIEDLYRCTWKQARDVVKSDYGEEYIESVIDATVNAFDIRNSKLQQVVDCMYDALTQQDPEDRYKAAGLLQKYSSSFFQFLPKSLCNSVAMWAMKAGVEPSMLRRGTAEKEVAKNKSDGKGM